MIGLVNGLVTVVLRVPSFVTTLGTAFLLSGLTLTFLSFPVQTPQEGTRFAEVMGHNQLWELGWALAVVLAVQVGLSYTRWGLYSISVGGNLLGAAMQGAAGRSYQETVTREVFEKLGLRSTRFDSRFCRTLECKLA